MNKKIQATIRGTSKHQVLLPTNMGSQKIMASGLAPTYGISFRRESALPTSFTFGHRRCHN
jgi:hypothetical protein